MQAEQFLRVSEHAVREDPTYLACNNLNPHGMALRRRTDLLGSLPPLAGPFAKAIFRWIFGPEST